MKKAKYQKKLAVGVTKCEFYDILKADGGLLCETRRTKQGTFFSY